MRVFVIVNQVEEIVARQTTALLIAALVRQQKDVCIANVDSLFVNANNRHVGVFANAVNVPADRDCQSEHVAAFAKSDAAPSIQKVEPNDILLIRTNPGRDVARSQIHESFLHLCTVAQNAGIQVVNSPQHLLYFASKSSLASVDQQFRPPLIVTSDLRQISDFIEAAPADCVAKPLLGSRGENVIRISKSTPDLSEKIHSTFGSTTLVVQHFVDSDTPGDKRVVVVGGQPLEHNGHYAGIERRPAKDDFRANLHAGGTAHELTLSVNGLAAVQYAANLLHRHGIWLAGVDLIGDKIIEFNVFSTGGLYDSINFTGVRFDDLIVGQLLASFERT